MGILDPIAAALGGKPVAPQKGAGPGYNPAPFPKQNIRGRTPRRQASSVRWRATPTRCIR